MFKAPEFWVAIAFLCFVGLLLKAKVPSLVTKALDDRADAIRKELEEARRLREEAQRLFADYQKKQREAEDEARAIVDKARADAEALAADTRKSLAETLERRTKLAEDKIARAEAQALSEVRSTAVDLAVAAAESILREKVAGASAGSLIEQSIRDLKGKLN